MARVNSSSKRSAISSSTMKRLAAYVRRVRQQRHVAGHQGGRGEAEELPVGEVPGHDRQHRPQRLVADEALGSVGPHRLWGEEALRVLGVEITDPRALVHLGL